MYNCKSDYALNKKDQEAIVYRDTSGKLVRLTAEDFSCTADFLMWKAWSDANYRESDLEGSTYAKHTRSLLEAGAVVPSPEMTLIEDQEHHERTELRRLLMEGLDTCLTTTQHRRLWLFCVEGMTEETIALAEGIKQQNVSKSILAAKKKMTKFLNGRV